MKCQLYRFWINRAFDDGQRLTARIARHLAGCEECRRWHERQSLVVQRLQAGRQTAGAIGTATSTVGGAAGATEVAPPFLRARILNELKADSRREAPVTFITFTRWAWVGAAVAAVALAMIAAQSSTKQAALLVAPNEPASAGVPKSATALIEATSRFADGGRLLQVATNLDQPLQEEMHLVLEDARAALRSLQLEFVPSALLAKRD